MTDTVVLANEEQRLQTHGTPVQGPAAFDGNLKRFINLTLTLAITEFRLKFYGSVLGYIWQLMRPLLLFGVLYIVFTQFIRIGGGVPHYPIILLTGIVLFTFLAEATSGSVACVVDRESLVRKIRFPRLAIPLSVVTTSFFNLLLNLVVVFIFLFAGGVLPSITWLELPIILVCLLALATGISMLLSSLYVRYRDMKPIWDVLLQTLFYGSPVLYPIESIPSESLRHLMMMNPFAVIIQQARHALIDVSAPSAADAAGGAIYLLIPATILVMLLAVGYVVFDRRAPKIAEEL